MDTMYGAFIVLLGISLNSEWISAVALNQPQSKEWLRNATQRGKGCQAKKLRMFFPGGKGKLSS